MPCARSIALGVVMMLGWAAVGHAHERSVKGNTDRRFVKTTVVPTNASATKLDLGDLIHLNNPGLSKATFDQLEHTNARLSLKWPIGNQALSEGARVWTEGWLVHASCEKDDGDYHVQLALTAVNPTECLIVEVPDPDFLAANNPMKQTAAKVRAAIRQIYGGSPNGPPPRPIQVRVEGQLFLDAHHYSPTKPNGGGGGGRGKSHCGATNLWEVHPMTAVAPVPGN
jgi:hypothetical protein